MRRWWVVWLACAVVCAVGGCARQSDDGAGAPGDGPRIVVLSPALAVIVSDLGLADRVVGRHGYDMVLDPGLPVCGEQGSINYEALVRAAPTHVLTEWGSRELPGRLVSLAERHGWVLRDYSTLTLGEVSEAAAGIAGLFPGADAAGVAAFDELVSGPEPEPVWDGRVLVVMGTSPQVVALGPGSAHQELLRLVGGVPAIGEGSPYMPMHAEDVLRLRPDAVVIIDPGGEGEAELGVLAGLGVPAVEAGRVWVVTDRLALLPSTRLVVVAEELARALAAWAGEEG